MKKEWRKEEKGYYLPKEEPMTLTIPQWTYLVLEGEGDPNGPLFSEHIEILYNYAYAIKMMPKSGYTPEGYFDYTVYPLEGVWDLKDEAKRPGVAPEHNPFSKAQLVYRLMIRQPDFVEPDVFERAKETVLKKNKHADVAKVTLERISDGLTVQMLHVGPYDEEPVTFSKIQAFMEEKGLKRRSFTHREIYLSDFRKTAMKDLKTVLRVFIEEV